MSGDVGLCAVGEAGLSIGSGSGKTGLPVGSGLGEGGESITVPDVGVFAG